MKSSEIVALVDQAIGDGRVEGVSVHVQHHGETVFEHAAGSAFGTAVRSSSAWWVASITKPVVAAGVLACVEDGTLRVDDPVDRYIPSFARRRLVRRLPSGGALATDASPLGDEPSEWVYDVAERPISVRHLLTMTSGLQTIGVPNAAIRPPQAHESLAQYVDSLADAPLDFQPGERWHYSNAVGFEVLARLIEVASGSSLTDFLRDRIFDPIGADTIDFTMTGRAADTVLPAPPFLGNNPIIDSFTSGSAGLFAPAADLARFVSMLVAGGAGRDGRVLSEHSVAQMTSNQIGDLRLAGVDAREYGGLPHRTNPGVGYGYGLLTVLDPASAGVPVGTGSFGWDGIGTRRIWGLPDQGLALVVLIEGSDADDLHRAIERAVVNG